VSPSTDAWNEIFKQQGKVFRGPHEDMPRVARLLRERGGSTILDLGCGTGRHVVYLARSGFSVSGLDSSPEGIRLTREWLEEEGLDADLRLQSMSEKLPFEDGFLDAVISVQVIHHADIATIRSIVQEIARVLKPGGLLFVTVPQLKAGRPCAWWGTSFERVELHTFLPLDGPEQGLLHHYFTPQELQEEFSGFDIAEMHVDSVDHHCLLGFKR
jgi:2-polyprenyl-3-methyl-5-hydroxy-6-metoxy-1,4-benzoquinol methylase